MSFQKGESKIKRCPKTGKIISEGNSQSSRHNWPWWLLPFIGLAALVWFLIRVIPKPSRATYPCQRMAFPIASGFVIWLTSLAGSAVAYKRAKAALVKSRYLAAAIFLALSVGFIWSALNNTADKQAFAHEPIVVNSPIGDAKGVNPGRVAWIHDSNAATWPHGDGITSTPYWHTDTCTDPVVVDEMLSKALRALTGKASDYAAWDAIFRSFNQQMGRGDVGYTPGEKIAIKTNWVLMVGKSNGTKDSWYYDQIDNSPQLAIALLRQLIDNAGVSPGDISIGDPQNAMADHWYNIVSAQCPGVVYIIKSGVSLSGRTPVAYDTSAPFYFSDPDSSHWVGVTKEDYIPNYFAQSDYFINFPILKSHNSGGMTVGGKNHYGSLMRAPNESGYYNMHWTRPHCAETSPLLPDVPGIGHYRANVDLMGHPKLGGKTMLVLVDFLYAGRSWDSHPIRWNMAPFNGNWPSSILLSQDQVAADSVAFDFMDNEWTAAPSNLSGHPQYSGTDDYLHEAALIPSPASGVNYDPNNDGGLTESLGVHEHWNNATNKQYSRNLDPVNGTGIELVTAAAVPGLPDFSGDWWVDFEDFAIFANAWGSTPLDSNWDPNCDISVPADGVIDELDLAVLCEHWLVKLTSELVVPGAAIEEVYSETGTSFEGPMWDPQSQKLFFSRRTSPWKTYRLDSPGVVTAWRDPAPQTNGMLLSLEGRMLACDESTMQVTSIRIDASGPADIQVLADSSDGFTKQPNDLCQLANGDIYFTTPTWDGSPASVQGVWLLEPNGVVTRVNNALRQPNGIIASLDGTKLYVSAGSTTASYQQWWVFDIYADGTLSSAALFFDPTSPPSTSNVPDGMTIDELGNLYFSGLGGIWIVSPSGEQLDFILLPQPVYNVAFGGPKGKTLYMTCNNKVYSLAMTVRGGGSISW